MNEYLNYLITQADIPHIYIIGKRPEAGWYFFNISNEYPNPVTWTRQQRKARVFTREEEVEEFQYRVLRNRKCEIIRLERT